MSFYVFFDIHTKYGQSFTALFYDKQPTREEAEESLNSFDNKILENLNNESYILFFEEIGFNVLSDAVVAWKSYIVEK